MTLCFKHGADWHEKRKHVKLIMETGYEGYGVYTVLLEYLLSAGGVLEISLNELNYLIRCETGLLKRILTNYDLFDVKSMEHGILCISVDWLLKDIEKARKTSKARSESGKKGLQNRYGVKNASELANTVGVPNNEKQEKSNVKQAKSTSKQAIATANATTNAIANAYTHARSVDENNTDDVGCCCTHTRESLRNLLPEMQKNTEWHGSLSAMMRQSNVNLASTDVPSLVSEFVEFQTARGKENEMMTLAEAKTWFCNWLLFKIEKAKQNGINNKPSVATSTGGNSVAAPTGYSRGYRKSFAEQVRESKEKLLRDTAKMLQKGELGSLGIGKELSRDLLH